MLNPKFIYLLIYLLTLFSCSNHYQNLKQGFQERKIYIDQWVVNQNKAFSNQLGFARFESELSYTEVKIISSWYSYFAGEYPKTDQMLLEVGKHIHALKQQKHNEFKKIDFKKGNALLLDQRLKAIEAQLLLGQIRRLIDQNRILSAIEQSKSLRLRWAKDIAYAMLFSVIPYYEEAWEKTLAHWGQHQDENFLKNLACQPLALTQEPIKQWSKQVYWWHCPKNLLQEEDDLSDIQLIGGQDIEIWNQSPLASGFSDKNRLFDFRGMMQNLKRFKIDIDPLDQGFYLSATQNLEIQQRVERLSMPTIDPLIELYFHRYLSSIIYEQKTHEQIIEEQQTLKELLAQSQAFLQLQAQLLEQYQWDEKALLVYQKIKDSQKTPFNDLRQMMLVLYLEKIEDFDQLFAKIKDFMELEGLLPFFNIVRDHKLGLFKKEFDLLKLLEQKMSSDQGTVIEELEKKRFCRVIKHFIHFNAESTQSLSAVQLWNCGHFDLSFERAVLNHELDFITSVFEGSFEYFHQHHNYAFFWKSYLNAIYIKYPKEFYLILKQLSIFKNIEFKAIQELSTENQTKFLEYYQIHLDKIKKLDLLTNLYDPTTPKNTELIWYLIDFAEKSSHQNQVHSLIQKLIESENDDENIKNYLLTYPSAIPYDQYDVDEMKVIRDFKVFLEKNPKNFPYYKVLEHHRLIFKAQGHYIDYAKQLIYVNSKDSIESLGEITVSANEKLINLYTIKPDLSRKYPIQIPEKSSYSLNDLQVGDIIYYESITDLPSEQRIPRLILGRLEPQHQQVPIFVLDDQLFIPKEINLFSDVDDLRFIQKHSAQAQNHCQIQTQQNHPKDLKIHLNQRSSFESLHISLSCHQTPMHHHFRLTASQLMPDYPEPLEPMIIAQKPYLSIYQPAQLAQLWDLIHWEIGRRHQAIALLQAEVLDALPYSLHRIKSLKDQNEEEYIKAMKENFKFLLNKAKTDIKINQSLLEMTLPHLSQKQEKGNVALYLCVLLEIAEIPYDLWLGMLEEKQRLNPSGLLGLDDYEYPLIEVFGELWDVHFLVSHPQLLPLGIQGTKMIKIWQFRPDLDPQNPNFLDGIEEKKVDQLIENFYDVKLELQIKDEKTATLKVLQNLKGELGIDLYERLKMVQEQELRQWISGQWNRWIGQHGLEQVKFEFKEGELCLSYQLSFTWTPNFQLRLLPQLWHQRFSVLPQRKHDLVIAAQNQDLILEIKTDHPLIKERIKQSLQKSLKSKIEIHRSFGMFSKELEIDDAALKIKAKWRLNRQVIQPEQYEEFKRFTKEVEEQEVLILD
jgi:hypothetical protein